MPLVAISELINRARAGRFALGYFECWNLESLQGVIDAAEIIHAPVIVGFNGEFLSHSQRILREDLRVYAALGKAAAEAARVPCGFIFNECSDDAWVRRAVEVGFNLVMPIAEPGESLESYTHRTAAIVKLAHARQVAVEAELGLLPSGESGLETAGSATDPQQAARFVAETGVDLLAVSVGNIHMLLQGQRELDLARLATLCQVTPVGLVLHGGSGISIHSLQAAIELGVCKINFGTYLKQHYLKSLCRALDQDITNPHHLLGYGGETDLLMVGRKAVREAVLQRMKLLNCAGKATG